MPDLLITRALPNPTGKDRTPGHLVNNDQLNGEWIEFQNTTQKTLTIDGVSIAHHTFNAYCQNTGEDRLTTFTGAMPVGSFIRLHTGIGEPWEDGAIRHLYLNRRNFVWNNGCGDTGVLRVAAGGLIDRATYERNPAEGEVLNRVPGTDRLAGGSVGATGTYGRW